MGRLTSLEPAAVAEGVRVVLIALVTLGWLTLDETAVNAVVSAVAAVLSLGLSAWTRAKVTPVAKLWAPPVED